MKKSKVLSKIRSGKVARICCLGHFLPCFPRHAAHFGYDGIWIDGEHRAFDPREAQALIAFHHMAGIDCIWRPPTLEKTGLYRLLEDGASGLMIPHVSTPEKARMLVEAVRFPPLGDRGLDAAGLDADYMVNLKPSYSQDANQETCLVVQIETPQAMENLDAIAAVPGIDVIFLGPGDLSLRLGCSAATGDPQMMEVQKKIAAVAKKHGKAWGRPAFSQDDVKTLKDMGAQFIVLGSEFWAIYSHIRDSSERFDAALGEKTSLTSGLQVAVP
ncbi:MAG: aldolase/citrate lyase family protein [Verrucomicrobiae bacterium]|nr:aldolase/citrate lyase family protein [Verrucomicrobiae bacterium]